MADVLGRCRELDYCSIGQMRTLVRVPPGRPFVCPECGKPLREPVLLNQPLSRTRIAWWCVGTLGVFVLLYEWFAPSGRHTHIAQAQLALVTAPVQRRPVLPPAPVPAPERPAPVPSTPPATGPVSPPPSAIAPIPPAPIPAVLGPPVPTPLVGAPLLRMPPPVPADAATSAGKAAPSAGATPASGVRVTMECTVDAAGVPSNCTPAKLQPPPPVPEAAEPVPPPQASEPAYALPASKPASKPALKVPADREPSTLPVAGGGPSYPSDYVRDGRAGEVAVDCIIDPSGEPEHCKVRDTSGGRRFAEATVDWLNSGTVRFAPAMRNGVPVAEEHRWRIAFPPR